MAAGSSRVHRGWWVEQEAWEKLLGDILRLRFQELEQWAAGVVSQMEPVECWEQPV